MGARGPASGAALMAVLIPKVTTIAMQASRDFRENKCVRNMDDTSKAESGGKRICA
jgi:hypothetical protein